MVRKHLKILLSTPCSLYFEGLKSLLSDQKDAHRHFSVYCRASVGSLTPDIVVVDGNRMDQRLFSLYPDSRFAVLNSGLTQEEVIDMVSRYRIHGVIAQNISARLFRKALEVIGEGEIWLGNNQGIQPTQPTERSSGGMPASLTEREKEVLEYVCAGYSNREIASTLFVSERTVKAHLNKIFKKLNITSRLQLVVLACKEAPKEQ